jgi:CRISPR/Cas system-associated exonuclease Cas4 (RecB family)
MAMLENVFSWSKSRDEQFRECQRKYYFDKYASWGGWDRSAPELTRLAYVYKNLKNRWAWKGETVHHLIEEVLKSLRDGKEIPLDACLQKLTENMRKDYRSSKAKKYFEDPKKNIGLFEHEYEKLVTDATWKEFHDSSAECIRNFYGSDFYKELLNDTKSNWLIIEDLEDFQFDGAKVYVKLDFARTKDGVIEIYDWKTGKEDAEAASVQMGAYAMYAMKKWNVGLDKIRAYLFNLGSAKPVAKNQALTVKLLMETEQVMRQSIKQMRELLQDPVKNIPHPVEKYLYTENARLCGYCNFYKICDKYLTK